MRFTLRRPRMPSWHPGWVASVSISVAIIYFEIISYNLPFWHNNDCHTAANCTRILIVADPQLIGVRNEHLGPLTYLSILDSDRYLRRTYKLAKFYTNPDVVLFVGDLFDEGSIAPKSEFDVYVERFHHIFDLDPKTHYRRPKYIFVPGDNDIGGEGIEPVKEEQIKYFIDAFGDRVIIEHHNITFYVVNGLQRTYPAVRLPADDPQAISDNSSLRVIVSHMPLLFKPSIFAEEVANALKAHVVFAGHEHNAMIVVQDPINLTRHVIPVTKADTDIHRLELRSQTYEIISPTCSYRMGTPYIGFGFAVIENNELRYTVLWSPSRFLQLGIYAAVAFLNFIYWLMCFRARSRRTCSESDIYYMKGHVIEKCNL